MDETELTEVLQDAGLKVAAIHKIRRKDTLTKYRDQLYIIHLEKGSTTLKQLKEIKAVNNVIVEWERYRPVHRDVTQCSNCLGFCHGGRNCHLPPRCAKCGKDHEQDECANEVVVAKCCNCDGDHPSNDRSCPKRTEFIQLRKNIAARRNQGRKKDTFPDSTSFPELPRRAVPNLTPLPLPQQTQRSLQDLTRNPPGYKRMRKLPPRERSLHLRTRNCSSLSSRPSWNDSNGAERNLIITMRSVNTPVKFFMGSTSLRIVNWNARSIAKKNFEFSDFLRTHQAHIAFVTKTHLPRGGTLPSASSANTPPRVLRHSWCKTC